MALPDDRDGLTLARPTSEALAANRARFLRWVEDSVRSEPTGWAEALAALNTVMGALAIRQEIDPRWLNTLQEWSPGTNVVMLYVCRLAMDAAGTPDYVVARAAASDDVPSVPLSLALATLANAGVVGSTDGLAEAAGLFGVRERMMLTKYTAITLSILDVGVGDLLEIAARAPSATESSG